MHSEYVAYNWFGPSRFNGVQFHFHAGSEHTIDGKRHDLEMHTISLPVTDTGKGGFNYAALGIIFSVNESNAILTPHQVQLIDNFFESLQWNVTTSDPKVAMVPYGDMMMSLDMQNRWVYRGSMTEPPCETLVYWNVLMTIYPIKQKHYDQFLN